MKKSINREVIRLSIFGFFILTFASCENMIHKCAPCFTPPRSFVFEITDKMTGENLYSKGFLISDDLKIINEKSELVKFQFIKENNLNLIILSEIGWKTGKHTYTITISKELSFTFVLDMQAKSDDCCTYFIVNKLEISQYDYEESKETGTIKIKI